jgi:type I restriction enzyme M protein
MITGELKNKIDSLWNIFAAGGLTNPLDVIEQITYLMFIRDLDDVDNIKSKESMMLETSFVSIFEGEFQLGNKKIDANQLKWSSFRDVPAANMYEIVQMGVFPFIKGLHTDKNSAYSKYMGDALLKIETPQLFSKIVDSLDEVYELVKKEQNKDTKGDLYEYLLSKISSAGRNGQFRTPRHIIRMMVEMMAPQPHDSICDQNLLGLIQT